MSWFRRGTPVAPAPAANGNRKFNQGQLNAASANLKTALNKIANQHVLKYANAIRANAKAQANAAHAAASAAAAPTPTNVNNAVRAANNAAAAHQNMIESEVAAKNAVNAAPPVPANNSTLVAETNAVNAVIKNIQNLNKPLNINAIKASNAYKKNSKRINNAIRARKNAVNPFSN